MRSRHLAALAPLALLLANCGGGAPEESAAPTEATIEAETTTPEPTETPVERTDLTVFIEEPEPLSVFAVDGLLCTTHSEVAEVLERVPAPRVQLFDLDGELLATQEVTGTGPVLDGTCMIFVKFLDLPVVEGYVAAFSGEDVDGVAYEFEEQIEFDQQKFDDGYTQGIDFEL